MKKLLLVALLLTAGIFTTEHVVANGSTKQSELKKTPKPPDAVLQSFAVLVAYYESFGDTQVVNITWSFSKGNFTASFYFVYYGEIGGQQSATYNRQGQRI